MSLFCTVSDITGHFPKLNINHVSFWGVIYRVEVPKLTRSKDMIGATKFKNGSRDLTTTVAGVVCHPWVMACYGQPTCQTVSQAFLKCDRAGVQQLTRFQLA